MEATLKNVLPLFAIINTDLLEWDSKVSHPWIAELNIKYDRSNSNGMPNSEDYELLNVIEDEIMKAMKDSEGYLNNGRQTADSGRTIYFACKDFRKPFKIFDNLKSKHKNRIAIDFDIYKDKYWRSLERFRLY
ncbi:DUF695 domain-containing protein [uncultured Algibacter sp.]|uniref:DUF695 domain-containing protein n=1 Tax=uncultured Algibacter sp. TaxID=298659 RepID=UPI00262269DC|nr:DUF695 domain-containing protein [uncultured Algibacter sp.]